MNNKRATYLNQFIGKYTRHAIYDKTGKRILPKEIRITYNEIILLEKHQITLDAEDVKIITSDFIVLSKVIDKTVEQLKSIYENFEQTKIISIDPIVNKIVPLIDEASKSKHILQLFAALQPKDDYRYRHLVAVGIISNLIGKWMDLSHQDLLELTTAALLQDVGILKIPDEILNKPGKLTDEEFSQMKKHTKYGYELLTDTPHITKRQARVALEHHERIDGSGYPNGLIKEDIDLFGQIVAIADGFHAMSSKRVYQSHFPFYKVIEEMERDMFDGLNPEITLLFMHKTMQSLIGHTVLLSDGRRGEIIMVPQNNMKEPLVQVEDTFVDLSKDKSLKIEQIHI